MEGEGFVQRGKNVDSVAGGWEVVWGTRGKDVVAGKRVSAGLEPHAVWAATTGFPRVTRTRGRGAHPQVVISLLRRAFTQLLLLPRTPQAPLYLVHYCI
jgi:hypothetical protein